MNLWTLTAACAGRCWRSGALLTVWMLACAATAVCACPSGTITLVVPYAPGGSMDVVARSLVAGVQQAGGPRIVISHIGGASGALGARFVAQSAPDGCHVLMGSLNAVVLAPILQAQAGFQPESLSPVLGIGTADMLLVASPALGLRRIDELPLVRQRLRRDLHVGHPGTETSQYLLLLQIERTLGESTLHVPYRGSGPMINDLLAGHIDLAVVAAPAALPHVQAQRLVRLGNVTDWLQARGLDPIRSWAGLFAVSGTPAATLASLHHSFNAALRLPSVVEALRTAGNTLPEDRSEQAFAAQVRADIGRWRALGRAASGGVSVAP